nr:circularly permuted type 2 ATP-grasp protein [Cesiribacter sp. SM1]
MHQKNSSNTNGMFGEYKAAPGLYDEVFDSKGAVHPTYRKVLEQFRQHTAEDFRLLDQKARQSFLKQGVTFTVGTVKAQGAERIFPFDLLPRIIAADEWEELEKGVIQRNLAINAFLHDIYHKQQIFKDKIVPKELVVSSKHYCKAMQDLNPAGGIYNHISGTDLIRHKDGRYYVLEDNVRTPSGISYVLANREAMKRSLHGLFSSCHARPLKEYLDCLLTMIHSVAPAALAEPCCAVLTDGMVASAYFEHAFLAQSMGIPLVEGKDLFVENNKVYMKTSRGRQQLNVLYRRVEDEYLDPLAFLPHSVYGVPGIMEAYRKGNISLVNAPGTGAADDKAVYSYVPAMIRYYLQEEPILQNVHTYHCTKEQDYQYVLEHMQELVVKPVDEFGGYGMLVGNAATKEQLQDFKERIRQNRRKYIAQPIMSLSTHPTFIKERGVFEPRHIDLRIYTLLGKDMQYVLQGGLTRVALKEGNLVVNSSQGGGSKDTWVLAPHEVPEQERTTADLGREAAGIVQAPLEPRDREPLRLIKRPRIGQKKRKASEK